MLSDDAQIGTRVAAVLEPGFTDSMTPNQWRLLGGLMVLLFLQVAAMVAVVIGG